VGGRASEPDTSEPGPLTGDGAERNPGGGTGFERPFA
jgi:hypothetical protein